MAIASSMPSIGMATFENDVSLPSGVPNSMTPQHHTVPSARGAQDLSRLTTTSMTGTRAYNFSKEAVIVWTMANSQRWWPRGIRLNSVSPGVIETPILTDFRESMGDDAIDWAIKAMGRVGKPSDIAPAIVFLASRATPWINGTNLIVDGGLMGAVTGGAFG